MSNPLTLSKIKNTKDNSYVKIPVYQFDLEGNFIRKYESYREVIEVNPTYFIQNIKCACKGIYKQSNGFLWSYTLDPPKVGNLKKPKSK